MKENVRFLLKYISIIRRETNRYFDMELEQFNMGSGQQFFLITIARKPGISMYDLAKQGRFDKATVTKAIRKLTEEKYVEQVVDEKDKRIKRLYLTESGENVLKKVKSVHEKWLDSILVDFTEKEKDVLNKYLERLAEQSVKSVDEIVRRKVGK